MKNKFLAIFMAMLAAVNLFTACSKDDSQDLVSIGFAQEVFGLDINNEATLRLVSTGAATNAEVAFDIISDLKEGVDYELSDKSFAFTAGTTEATVKVKFLNLTTEELDFKVQLKPTSFANFGLSNAQIAVNTADAILYTFDKSNYTMTASTEITLQLSKVVGSFVAEKELIFEVELDASSTAVENEHFKFTNGKTIKIAAGQNKGTIKIDLIKQVKGKDQIVLKLKQVPFVFKAGNYDKANVVVFGTYFDKIKGSWKYASFYNLTWWDTSWGIETDNFPTNNSAADIITFDEEGIKVDMKGDIKNYFRNSVIKNKGEVMEVFQEDGLMARGNILLIDALANVSFSASKIVEREAEIGLRTLVVDGKEYLEVTIRDYEPVDFAQDIFSFMSTSKDKPAMKSAPLRFRFEKVNN